MTREREGVKVGEWAWSGRAGATLVMPVRGLLATRHHRVPFLYFLSTSPPPPPKKGDIIMVFLFGNVLGYWGHKQLEPPSNSSSERPRLCPLPNLR